MKNLRQKIREISDKGGDLGLGTNKFFRKNGKIILYILGVVVFGFIGFVVCFHSGVFSGKQK